MWGSFPDPLKQPLQSLPFEGLWTRSLSLGSKGPPLPGGPHSGWSPWSLPSPRRGEEEPNQTAGPPGSLTPHPEACACIGGGVYWAGAGRGEAEGCPPLQAFFYLSFPRRFRLSVYIYLILSHRDRTAKCTQEFGGIETKCATRMLLARLVPPTETWSSTPNSTNVSPADGAGSQGWGTAAHRRQRLELDTTLTVFRDGYNLGMAGREKPR